MLGVNIVHTLEEDYGKRCRHAADRGSIYPESSNELPRDRHRCLSIEQICLTKFHSTVVEQSLKELSAEQDRVSVIPGECSSPDCIFPGIADASELRVSVCSTRCSRAVRNVRRRVTEDGEYPNRESYRLWSDVWFSRVKRDRIDRSPDALSYLHDFVVITLTDQVLLSFTHFQKTIESNQTR